jgi:hypothetical protein
MGVIGGNDYNHALLQNRPLEEVRTFVPDVINALGAAVNVSKVYRTSFLNFFHLSKISTSSSCN